MAFHGEGEGNFANGAHDDLFETLSEAHYLPELGAHDEGLLESLVEKGCEDNQVLGRALAQLVAGGYEPVSHLIDRLELGSPARSAAQSLLHLSNATDQQYPAAGHSYSSTDPAYPSANHAYLSSDQTYATVVPTYTAADQTFVTADQSYQSAEHPYPSAEELCNLGQLADNALQPPPPDHAPLQHHQQPIPPTPPPEPPSPQHPLVLPPLSPPPQSPPESMYSLPDVTEHFQPPLSTATPLPLTPSDESTRHSPHPPPDQSDFASSTEETITKEEPIDELAPQNDLETDLQSENLCTIIKKDEDDPCNGDYTSDFDKDDSTEGVELVATDLSIKHVEKASSKKALVASAAETTEECAAEKEELPRDLTLHRVAAAETFSPRRLEIPRAPSRESDAMQSPQPSGIPAIPSSPEHFIPPPTKSKQALFLETLLSSPSPKMYTSEVTISKQRCEPLNLGKHRKSASPTVSSCTDDIRKLNKEFGEPQEKRIRRESIDDMVKISKVFTKTGDEGVSDTKSKKSDRTVHKSTDENSPLQQFHILKSKPEFYLPDPLLVPKNKLNDILAAPGREIPSLLIQRPELRLPDAFQYPSVLQDPDIIVISLQQLEQIMVENETKTRDSEKQNKQTCAKNSEHVQSNKADQTSQAKSPGAEALAGDIDAATSAALNQMFWLPYINQISQMEAAAACSQNMDFLRALNSSGYSGSNYPDLSQLFSPASRLMGSPSGYPMLQPNDYDRLQFAMWQEAMNQANNASRKSSSTESAAKEASKSSDVQHSHVHSTKNHQSSNKGQSSARTSPVARNYNAPCQRSTIAHNPFLQSMYQGMNPNIRPNVPLAGLQIPYYNPMMGSQRSPRSSQQKSPTSPYFPNNNYLQSLKQQEAASAMEQRSSSTGSQEGSRPRISVKNLQNLMKPGGGEEGGSRTRRASSSSGGGWRREEHEVGSTTPGEPPAQPPPPSHPLHPQPHPHPHDPIHHLWHPLFGNQKNYAIPGYWTTVTATGD